jgi:hypothetical protein
MARQDIKLSRAPVTWEKLSAALNKVNDNFVEIYPFLGSVSSSFYIGTTAVSFNRASEPLTLTGVSITGNAATVTNGVYTSSRYNDPAWIQTLDAAKLSGSIVATNGVVTTGTYANPSWITSLDAAKLSGSIVATNGVVTTGTYADPAWITSLSGTKLTGLVTATNGVITTGSYANPAWITSLAGSKITNAVLDNQSYNNPSWITALAGAKITGTVPNATTAGTVTTAAQPAITSVGTLTGLTVSTAISADITGNAGTVTNGVYTSGTYNNPSWITGLAGSKISGDISGNSGGVNLVADDSSNSTRFVVFGSSSSGAQALNTDTGFTYNPNTETLTAATFSGALSGNASTATKLATARNINGVAFDGSAAITVTAAADTLTGTTLASGVTGSSLTSVGTLTGLTVSGSLTMSSTTASAVTSILARSNGSTTYQLTTQNGTSATTTGSELARIGLNVNGTGWDSYTVYTKGATAQTGSQVLYAANTAIATVDSTGLAVTGKVSATTNITNAGIDITSLNVISVGGTGTTQTLSSTKNINIIVNAAAGYSTTLNMPGSPTDGQICRISVHGNNCILVAGTGTLSGSYAGSVTAGTANFTFVYRSSNSTWYRIQ